MVAQLGTSFKNTLDQVQHKTYEAPPCRLCGGLKRLFQREYIYRKPLDKGILWEMCSMYGVEYSNKCYDYQSL